MSEKTYGIKQVSVLLGVKVRTIREWIKCNKIKANKNVISKRWMIPESEIERLIAERYDDEG